MEQVNPKFVKFQNDCSVYHLLEEVFVNQDATGDFNSGFENDPRTSAEEQDMETAARCARGKKRSDYADEDANVEVVRAKDEKGKKSKGKRKSGDCSSGSPISIASGSVTNRYLRALNIIESLVSQKKCSSMSVSVNSPTKHHSDRDRSKKSDYDVSMEQLWGLENVAYVAKMAAAEILNDSQELAIWNLAGSDADRIIFMKLKGCLLLDHDTQEPPPLPPL
ncbi:uncharacterized protein [Coffea arabica]|uniref:Uncharacterized protein n=1 Tax=Coffea arabica TaxID=13443 RepID=A0ABM4W8A2_COFAR